MISFTVPFVPTKRRVRSTRRGVHYTDAKTKEEMRLIAEAASDAGAKPLEGEVAVVVVARGSFPKSLPKGVETRPQTRRPDADNICKCVLDALNGVAYADDAQVVSLRVEKLPDARGIEPFTHVVVREREQEE